MSSTMKKNQPLLKLALAMVLTLGVSVTALASDQAAAVKNEKMVAAAAYDINNNPFFTKEVHTFKTLEETRAYNKETTAEYMKNVRTGTSRMLPFTAPKGYVYDRIQLNDLKYEKIAPEKVKTNRVVLQFHGGGYVLGLGNGYRYMALLQSKMAGNAPVYLLDYDTVPNALFPTQVNQAVALYDKLLASGTKPNDVVVIGDSAGANLTAAFALKLKELNKPQPAGLVLVSPWASVHPDLPTRAINIKSDYVLGEGTPLHGVVEDPKYTDPANYKDPIVSPLYGDVAGLAPMLIQAGGDELFLSDAAELAARVEAEQGDVQLTIYPGMSHDWPLVMPQAQASRDSWKEIEKFMKRVYGK